MLSDSFLHRLDAMRLRVRRSASGGSGGLRRSKALGSSVEFSDFREYAPGDDVRRIDWNAYARFDRLFMKLFMEEQEQRVNLVVDASASMDFGEPSKWEAAKTLAQTLCYLALASGDRVTVYALHNGGETHTRALTARHQYPQAAAFLDGVAPAGAASLDWAATGLRLPAGSGVCVVIGDLLCEGGYERFVQSLLYKKQETSVFQLLCREDWEPSLEDVVTLTDSETGEKLTLGAGYDALRRYRDAARAYVEGAHAFCAARGVAHAMLVPEAPLEDGLLRALGDLRLIG